MLAKLANTRWNLNYRDRDLKRIGRDELSETLVAKAHETIEGVDLGEGKHYLEEDFGVVAACGWVNYKFGFQLDPAEMAKLDPESFKQQVRTKANEAYEAKEIASAVLPALRHFTTRDGQGQPRLEPRADHRLGARSFPMRSKPRRTARQAAR